MNYYPFNVGDYAAHTAHLEPMEDLAYRRLLDQYYLREGALPADIQATAKLVRMRSMAAEVESVLREFFTLTDEGWRHSRCDAEVDKMQDKQAKARASAAASVSARQAKAQRAEDPVQASVERSLASLEAFAERSFASKSTDVELPTPTPTPTDAVAKATDGKPAVDKSKKPKTPADRAKADLWKAAVAVLAQGGCSNEAMARSFMGKLVTDYGLDAVKLAVDAAVTAQPADAREYLKATCQRHKGERRDPVTVPSDTPEKTLAMLESQRLSPEQRAASEEARRRVMSALKVVA